MKRRKLFIPNKKKKDGRIFACGRYVQKRACVKKEGEQRAIATVKEREGERIAGRW